MEKFDIDKYGPIMVIGILMFARTFAYFGESLTGYQCDWNSYSTMVAMPLMLIVVIWMVYDDEFKIEKKQNKWKIN